MLTGMDHIQKERVPFSWYPELRQLMETGEPVCVSFKTDKRSGKGSEELPEKSGFLFCELVQKARMGEKFRISGQSCAPGDYVLGLSEKSPAGYYLQSGRYRDMQAAEKAALSLPRLKRKFCSVVIEPLSLNRDTFDVLILFLKPQEAMRIVQANAYSEGERTLMDTTGAASICGDCTALALERGIGLSFGCKGSRKHSGYEDFEVPLGIAFEKIEEIEEGLSKLPETTQ
ncbi:Protein clustered with O-phosphoseryl-tRNA(Cys) synthetase [Methanosarcina siciliae C2J]|uniref:Protein clustered with O-phosphoseryl-tRNA(Cys) synthetase n=2 Tax=Methanosarcina siciliae TaxID=38027 RepID=A0A0E3PIF1_9EURY|nr:Protein clustered with O-phosphoseryl-tRNA(Cys) synthetase [Methanosarcina siciliae C2J]